MKFFLDRRKRTLLLFLILSAFCSGCEQKGKEEQWAKGYDLPVEAGKENEVEQECLEVVGRISDIYRYGNKGEGSNIILSDETLERMQEEIGKLG